MKTTRVNKERMKKILQLIGEGREAEEIAKQFRVAKSTVINLAKRIDYHNHLIWLEEYANDINMSLEQMLMLLIKAEKLRYERDNK